MFADSGCCARVFRCCFSFLFCGGKGGIQGDSILRPGMRSFGVGDSIREEVGMRTFFFTGVGGVW